MVQTVFHFPLSNGKAKQTKENTERKVEGKKTRLH